MAHFEGKLTWIYRDKGQLFSAEWRPILQVDVSWEFNGFEFTWMGFRIEDCEPTLLLRGDAAMTFVEDQLAKLVAVSDELREELEAIARLHLEAVLAGATT